LDQQAVAALLVRQTMQRAESRTTAPADVLRWLDKLLIQLVRKLSDYRKGDPASLSLPREIAQLPGLVFHLRRSNALRTSSASPDRTAFFRSLASTLSVFAMLVMVQPTLVGYQLNGPPHPLPLDNSAMAPERLLLLDSFTQVLVCKGAGIASWLRSPEQASNEGLQKLLAAAKEDAAQLEKDRFPAPEMIECDQFTSKARYVTQKLNPDVPLTEFLQGLYRAAVA